MVVTKTVPRGRGYVGVHRWMVRVALAGMALCLALAHDVVAAAPDPASRGLDLFLHVPPEVSPGAEVPLQVVAYAFPSVTRAVPLPMATLEAQWDPEQVKVAGPSVHATTDAEGRTQLSIPMPPGDEEALPLLVGVRFGAHQRTRTLTIKRGPTAEVDLELPDTRVVPGSTISAYIRATSAQTGLPLVGQRLDLDLVEGDIPLRTQELTTDAGGIVMARVAIPRIDQPVWRWILRAHVPGPHGASAERALTPREETPGMPTLTAEFQPPDSGAQPGDTVPYIVRLRDASGHVLVDHEARVWIGQGSPPPRSDKDQKAWLAASTPATTDAVGEVRRSTAMPTLVKTSGASVSLLVRTEVEGHWLEASASVPVGRPSSSAELFPEAHAVVPGLAQHLLLRVEDGRGRGIAGEFLVTGDGLDARVTTDAQGEADVTWNAPVGVGATRNVGPCAGGVAAAVIVRAATALPGLESHRQPFALCVAIDRDADAIVRADPLLAHPGERVRVTIARAGARRPVSVLATRGGQTLSTWIDAARDAGEIALPADASAGPWELSAASPDGAREARTIGASFFVTPRVLPQVRGTRVGGRAAPGGTIEVVADLGDGHGKPLAGSISAVVIDAHGGGSLDFSSLDERSRLCKDLGVATDRCLEALEGGAAAAPLLRGMLGTEHGTPIAPSNDPGAAASKELSASFNEVLRSLEGAVFEASQSPDKLIDVRRREGGRWVFNPELFTLATDAMQTPPLTPGGELLTLPDLIAVDPQVTFDNVARRVTRLKLFRALLAVRTERRTKQLDPDEPVWKDPNALLRRLVQGGQLTADALLDPWGGTLQFVRSSGPTIPFLTAVHGFELRAPGPDGVVGTADDVRDPFERVVRSGSPYAIALQEDRLVDAKWDMQVSDETVTAWQTLMDELTGTSLGLTGVGEGGGGRGEGIGLGQGFGNGHGRLGGRHSSGISIGDAYWSPPVRTDAQGRVHFSIPLGDVETTWRIAFVGVPDGAFPAASTLDVASDLPLSAQVDTGAAWTEGDLVLARVTIRNRSAKLAHASVTMRADGVAELAADPRAPRGARAIPSPGAERRVTIDVPAGGSADTTVPIFAGKPGQAGLVVATEADGLPGDSVRHAWDVGFAGEERIFTEAGWVEGARTLGLTLDDGYRLRGRPTLVIERGYEGAIADALDSLEPERQRSPSALLDALDAATRIERWAHTRSSPRAHALEGIAHASARRALAHYRALAATSEADFTEKARIRALAGTPSDPRPPPECPPDAEKGLEPLEVEPETSVNVPPCWGAFVANASRLLGAEDDKHGLAAAVIDVHELATALMALAPRPAHAALATNLVSRLRRHVKLDAGGEVVLPGDRAERSLVYAALLRAHAFGQSPATADVLAARLAGLRDATGGYGSPHATLAAVEAILSSQLEGTGTSHVRVRATEDARVAGAAFAGVTLDVGDEASIRVPLPPGLLQVRIESKGPGVLARLDVPLVRLWTHPPPAQASPLKLAMEWPEDATAGNVRVLRVLARQTVYHDRNVDLRIPLPPGVTLASVVGNPGAGGGYVVQLQGVLAVHWAVSEEQTVIEVPLRFGLAGTVRVPEATGTITGATFNPARSPASTIVVR